MVARYAIGVGLGALVTFALFFLMQAIIATNEANLDEGVKGKLLDFVRLQDDQEIETKQRKPKPPPPPDVPPPDMPKPDFESKIRFSGEAHLLLYWNRSEIIKAR